MPRPLLPRRDGPRGGGDENPAPRRGSARCGDEAHPGAGMGRGGVLHRLLLQSDDATLVIQEVGRRAMLVLVVAPERAVSEIDTAISRFAKAAAQDLD